MLLTFAKRLGYDTHKKGAKCKKPDTPTKNGMFPSQVCKQFHAIYIDTTFQ